MSIRITRDEANDTQICHTYLKLSETLLNVQIQAVSRTLNIVIRNIKREWTFCRVWLNLRENNPIIQFKYVLVIIKDNESHEMQNFWHPLPALTSVIGISAFGLHIN